MRNEKLEMRNEGGGFAEIEGSGRSCSGIRYLTNDVSRAQDDETGRCPKVVCKSQSHLGLLIPSYSSLVTHSRLQTCSGGFAAMLDDGISVSSAFPSRGRCPEGADRVTMV